MSGLNHKFFEEYLQAMFMEDYHGDKEHFEDEFTNWLGSLDIQEVMDYGEEAIKQHLLQGQASDKQERENLRKYFDSIIEVYVRHPQMWEAICKRVNGSESGKVPHGVANITLLEEE